MGKATKNPAHEGLPETVTDTQPDNAPDYQLQVAGLWALVLFFFPLLFYKLNQKQIRKSSPHRPHLTGTSEPHRSPVPELHLSLHQRLKLRLTGGRPTPSPPLPDLSPRLLQDTH